VKGALRAGRFGQRTELRAGPLFFEFCDGDLRGIKLHDSEILQRVYVAVRDSGWGTAPNLISDVRIGVRGDSSSVAFTAVSRNSEVDVRWRAEIEGRTDGTISFSFAGEAACDFRRNRIGLCVLHPAALAGTPCRWGTVSGETGQGAFPFDVSPHQPFRDLRWFSHEAAPGLWVRLELEGDVFEMEDQRNWTDGSFKIYGTPLSLPFPVGVRAGERVRQRVTLSLEGAASGEPVTPSTRRRRPGRAPSRVEIGEPTGRTLCPIGFGLGPSTVSADSSARIVEGLEPDHLRIEFDLDVDDWRTGLPRALRTVRQLGQHCWCLLLTSSMEIPAGVARVFADAGVAPVAVLVTKNVPPWNTDRRLAESARAVFAAEGMHPLVGGGTDGYFAELNRTRPPADVLDLVFYSAHPQVHAVDDRSIIENLGGLAPTVRTAIGFSEGKPACVSPLTLARRVDPAPHDRGALPMPRDRVRSSDPRQGAPFCAAWTLAALRRASAAGAHTVTFFDLSGLGDTEGGFRPHPVHDVFRRLAGWQGAEVLAASCADPFVDALALRAGGRRLLLAANLSSEPRTVIAAGDRLRLSGYGGAVG
jgi:D-apionolactonase